MKYKVGDKVVIRISADWHKGIVDSINKLPNRVATIKEVDEETCDYWMEEIEWNWTANDIVGLVPEPEPITRFEMMDFE